MRKVSVGLMAMAIFVATFAGSYLVTSAALSWAQTTVRVVAWASSNSRINLAGSEVRVFAAASLKSNGLLNGMTGLSVYRKWSYFGAATRLTFVSETEAYIFSQGKYTNETTGQSVDAVAKVRVLPSSVGFEISSGAVVKASTTTPRALTWGQNAIQAPLSAARRR